MTLHEQLVAHCTRVHMAVLPADKMKALYGLRQFLNQTDNVELFISVEVALHNLEENLSEDDKDEVRELGYLFPEDLDEPRKMFCDE